MDDVSEVVDLAADEPERLQALEGMFIADAVRYNVKPLDDRFAEHLNVTLRPSYYYGRKHVTCYPGMMRQPGSGPNFIGMPMQVTATVTVPDADPVEGVIFALGGDAGGIRPVRLGGARSATTTTPTASTATTSSAPTRSLPASTPSSSTSSPTNPTRLPRHRQAVRRRRPSRRGARRTADPAGCGTECFDVG